MKRIKIVGLCLVAVFAFTALAASAASAAEPAYFACVKTAGGKFSEKTCKTPGEGKTAKYELVQGNGKGKKFSGKGGAAKLTTPKLSSVVECSSFKDSGLINKAGTGQEKVVSIFGKCTTAKKNCSSAGAKKGEIKTGSLQGVLGYISKSPLSVGVLLTAEGGGALAEFDCEGLKVKTTGGVIGALTGGINSFSKSSTDTFSVDGANKQVPQSFEGGATHVLSTEINGEGPFESGQQAVAVNKGEELEIKA
jgi:hypothetical protein